MNNRIAIHNGIKQLLAVVAVALGMMASGCETQGPDVIDQNGAGNDQVALMAIGGAGGSELTQYREANGLRSPTMYATANGAPLGLPIDAMDESNNRLFLHHRMDGSITVLDIATYKKLGKITGLHPGTDSSGLCALAFSNLSQAWAVCYGTQSLFLLDAVNYSVARQLPMPDMPTCVGTAGVKVVVGLSRPNGAGALVVLSSNSGTYNIEKTFNLPSTPVTIVTDQTAPVMYVITSSGAQSSLFIYDSRTQELSAEFAVPVPDLNRFIGREPNYVSLTQFGYLYLIGPNGVWRMSAQGPSDGIELLSGTFTTMAADFYTDLVYAVSPVAPAGLVRMTFDGQQLPTVDASSSIGVIRFLNPSKVGP